MSNLSREEYYSFVNTETSEEEPFEGKSHSDSSPKLDDDARRSRVHELYLKMSALESCLKKTKTDIDTLLKKYPN